MPVISSGTANQLRRVFGSLLSHTYTRTAPGTVIPVDANDTEYDDWGTPQRGASSTESGLPCQWSPTLRTVSREEGVTLIRQPNIKIENTDTLKVGDTVTNITDQDGIVLEAGPFKVMSIEPLAGLGYTIQKRALLSAGEAVST